MRSLFRLLLVFLVLLAGSALAQSPIEFESNPLNGANVNLKYLQTIQGEGENLLTQPRDMVMDKDGFLYVLDGREPHVFIFDPSRHLISNFGKRGQGPGEFESPAGIALGPNRVIYITDSRNSSVTLIDENGKFIDRLRLKASTYLPYVRVLSNGNMIHSLPTGLSATEKDSNPPFSTYNPKGKALHQFGDTLPFEDAAAQISGNAVDFCMKGDTLYASFIHQNRIESYLQDGTLLFSIQRTRQLPYKVSLEAEMETTRQKGLVRWSAPRLNRFSCGIGIDNKNHIWIMTLCKQPKFKDLVNIEDDQTSYLELEQYDRNGKLLGLFPIKTGLDIRRNLFVFGDRLFIKDSANAAIYEYQILDGI